MNWFLAKMIYRISIGNIETPAQFEEQLRLILAADESTAIQKAKDLGTCEAFSFYNDSRQLVQWKFIDVTEIVAINQLVDGAEVYSALTELPVANNYIKLVQDKAALLQQRSSCQIHQNS